MTPERKQRIHSVLRNRQPDLTVLTDKVVKDRNLAAIVRTCDAVGIQTMHCIDQQDDYRTYNGTSASAQKYVDVVHHSEAGVALGEFRNQGYQIIAADFNESAVDYRKVDFTRPTVLVMGAEIEGVSDNVLSEVDQSIIVPMMGMVESFNVSVACAVILSEAQRQRQEAQMYGENRIPPYEYQRLFFRWAYPKLAKFCDERGEAYPDMDENYDLLPGQGVVV